MSDLKSVFSTRIIIYKHFILYTLVIDCFIFNFNIYNKYVKGGDTWFEIVFFQQDRIFYKYFIIIYVIT